MKDNDTFFASSLKLWIKLAAFMQESADLSYKKAVSDDNTLLQAELDPDLKSQKLQLKIPLLNGN